MCFGAEIIGLWPFLQVLLVERDGRLRLLGSILHFCGAPHGLAGQLIVLAFMVGSDQGQLTGGGGIIALLFVGHRQFVRDGIGQRIVRVTLTEGFQDRNGIGTALLLDEQGGRVKLGILAHGGFRYRLANPQEGGCGHIQVALITLLFALAVDAERQFFAVFRALLRQHFFQ